MKKQLLTVLSCAFALCGCAMNTSSTGSATDSSSLPTILDPLNAQSTDMSDYEGMADVETIGTFHELTWYQLETILSGEVDGVVYLGYPDCEACNKAIEPLNDAAVQSDALIYYMDITSAHIDDVYNDILDSLGNLVDEEDDERTFDVPLVIAVEDGKIVASQSGVPHDIGTDDDEQLTDSGKEVLKNIYISIINS